MHCSTGSGNGQFDGAFDMGVDAKNNVYVIDYGHNRIQMFQQPISCASRGVGR
ncbi:MAG TPA: hypothetical protein VKE41_10770 [Roseiflexaceae bacterium]|nr:hypothetical protein [Roseiflexaceae bacterium]